MRASGAKSCEGWALGFSWRSPLTQLLLLLAVAILLGGGGVGFGLCNLLVQLAGLLVLALNADAVGNFFGRAPRALVLLAIISLAIPLLQLIPLPPVLWRALPGRDLVEQSLEIIGRANAWRAFSVDANRTFIALLSMLPVLAVLVLVVRLSADEITRLLQAVVAFGLFCALIGGMQLITGNTMGVFYAEMVQRDDLYGLFASHNASGLFFDIALAALFALPMGRRNSGGDARGFALRLVVGAILVLAVVLTRSRSSMALMLVVLLFGLVRQLFRGGRRYSVSRNLLFVLGATVVVAGGGYFASNSYRVQASLKRFDNLEDSRPHIWEDARSSARRFFPVGAGMGVFDEVFQVDESLEYLDVKRAGRAHNDYLEVAIEAGLAGLLLIACWIGWFLVASWRSFFGSMRWQGVGAGVALATIALQSFIDYPLRNQTTLVFAAVMVGILAVASSRKSGEAGIA